MEENVSLKQVTQKVKALVELINAKNAQIALLEEQIKNYREEIKRSYAENVELQEKYKNLTIAQGLISLSNNDIAQAKAKLTTMMKTIDRCIDKINEDNHE